VSLAAPEAKCPDPTSARAGRLRASTIHSRHRTRVPPPLGCERLGPGGTCPTPARNRGTAARLRWLISSALASGACPADCFQRAPRSVSA